MPPQPVTALRRLGGIEAAAVDATGHAFPPHGHDEFVISATVTGRELTTVDGRRYEASVDEVTAYDPGAVQSGRGLGTFRFVSLYVEAPVATALAGRPDGALLDAPVVVAPDLARRLRRLVPAALAGADGETVREDVALLLGDLFERAAGTAPRERRASTEVRRAAARLAASLAAPPPLARLAGEVGLTPVGLVRAFAAERGLTPYRWLRAERLRRAREALRTGAAPATVAAEFGFSDQAHLTRQFRAAFGITPAAYAAA